jgi:hypothetical protein
MENTYTYTARSAVDPHRIVTFTLHGDSMSVGPGAPVEQVERVIRAGTGEDEEDEIDHRLWLKPLAISLAERGIRPFRIVDVDVSAEDDWLSVRAWIRTGGLRLAPVPLISGRVDNPEAAHAFATEVARRKQALGRPGALLGWLDYWVTWLLTGAVVLGVLEAWRRGRQAETD